MLSFNLPLFNLLKMKHIFMALVFFGCQNLSFAQCDLILCDQAPSGDTIPCEIDIDVTQYLENEVEYDPYTGDSIGVELAKTLYFIVGCVDPFEVDKLTFVLRETMDAAANIYKDIESKTLEVQPDWNFGWISWKFTREGIFWMDVRYNDVTFSTTLVEIDTHE